MTLHTGVSQLLRCDSKLSCELTKQLIDLWVSVLNKHLFEHFTYQRVVVIVNVDVDELVLISWIEHYKEEITKIMPLVFYKHDGV